eukprot:TRINITY_DN9670_c0_g1_i1.p1 TRINITY_DN9670_c0_g1~~TRINITY_DN9670_c0_g1_i1.p1  ORF type:complete len:222 (-),score=39.35 TRINITY_DN9670_c0_g1_i1:154-819(-)
MKFFDKLDKFNKKDSELDKYPEAIFAIAHFCLTVVSREHVDDMGSILKIFQDYVPEHRNVVRLLEGALQAHFQLHNPIGLFCKTYQRAKRLTGSLDELKPMMQDGFHPVGIQARALAYLHLFIDELSPVSLQRQQSLDEISEESSEDEIIDQLCASEDVRIELLTELYPLLSPCTLKAIIAFVLSVYHKDQNDVHLAEKLAFESVPRMRSSINFVPVKMCA